MDEIRMQKSTQSVYFRISAAKLQLFSTMSNQFNALHEELAPTVAKNATLQNINSILSITPRSVTPAGVISVFFDDSGKMSELLKI